MTRDISRNDSAAAVDTDHLLVVLDPASDDPISQSISDVIRAIFSQDLQTKLEGINAGAEINLTGAALQNAIDAATGGTVWRSAHAVLRTAVQVRDLLDGLLGTGWRDGGGGGGISLDQAIDGMGAVLNAIDEFTYDANANTIAFAPVSYTHLTLPTTPYV